MLDKEDLEWNLILRKNFTHLSLLLDFLEIEASKRSFFQNHSFKLNLSRRLAEKISKNNLLDPLLKQFVPTSHEHETVTGFCIDPLAEKEALKTSCLIHKYQGRVLLLTSSVCPINCRFCFRKYFDYPHPTYWDKEKE